MAEIRRDNPEYFTKSMKRMGNIEYRNLEATLEAIENFEKRKSPKGVSRKRKKELFEEAKARIENWGSADFELRRAIIYKENYLKMLEKSYKGLSGYEELYNFIKSSMNPIELYETIKKLEDGEKLKDITFMYTTSEAQAILNTLIEELKIEVETEDSEFI